MEIVLLLIWCAITGFICMKIGTGKGYGAGGMFALGALLNLIGIIVALVMPYKK